MLIQKDQLIIVNGNPSSTDLGTPSAFFDDDLSALQAQSGYHALREIIIEVDDTGSLHGAAAVTSTGTVLNLIALPNPPYGRRPPGKGQTIAEYLAG